MSEDAMCQFSGPEVVGFTHSDRVFCFPIVLLYKTIENIRKLAIFEGFDLKRGLNR